MKVTIIKTTSNELPKYETEASAGMDLRAELSLFNPKLAYNTDSVWTLDNKCDHILSKTKIFLRGKRGEINNHIDKTLYPGLSRPMVTLHSESYLSSELIRLVQYGLSGFTWH